MGVASRGLAEHTNTHLQRRRFTRRTHSNGFKGPKKKSSLKQVFVSKQLPEKTIFNRFNIKLDAQALIEITPISFNAKMDVHWVFFSSVNAVKSYFKQETPSRKHKYAAISKATAKELQNYVSELSFIGEDDVKQTAQAFAKILQTNEKVLFPISNKSRKTIQKALNKTQIIEVEVYKNTPQSKKIQAADVYVFTSPSNVNAFFLENNLPKRAEAVVMGESTKEALEKHCKNTVRLPWAYNNLALWDAI